MKKTIIFAILMTCMAAFSFTREEAISKFDQALANDDYALCGQCILDVYEYRDGNRRSRIQSEQTDEMCEKMWVKWIDSDKQLDDATFKIMVRDLNSTRTDLVKKTMKKNLPQQQIETLLFDIRIPMFSKCSDEEYKQLVHSHLLDKCVSENMFPLAMKYRLAMEFWPDEFHLINYDKKFFTYENDRMQLFFYHMVIPELYQYSQIFLIMAEKYIALCKDNTDNIVKMVQKLDTVYNTKKYSEKYYTKFDGNFNVQFELAYTMDSQDKMVDLLVKNTDNMTFDQVERVVYALNAVDDEYRKTDIDNILKNLKTKYGNKETESTAWEKLIEKIDAMIELRAD